MRIRHLLGLRIRIGLAITFVAVAAVVATFVATSVRPSSPQPDDLTVDRIRATLIEWGTNNISYSEPFLAELEDTSGVRIVVAAADSDTVIADSRGELVAVTAPGSSPTLLIDPLRPEILEAEVEAYRIDLDIAESGGPADPVRVWLNPPTGSAFVTNIGLTSVALILLAVVATAVALSTSIIRPLRNAVDVADRLARGDDLATHRRSTITEVADLNNALVGLDEQLRHAADRRRGVVDELAHEIRTPLTSALGRLRGVREGYFNADDELIDGIIGDLELLDRLVGELRTVTVAEQGQLPLDVQAVEVDQVIGRAVAAEVGNANVRMDTADERVAADPQRLEQILRNLLSNAVRYGAEPIEITTATDGNRVEICVRDHGDGIDDADVQRVFERFYRADTARSTDHNATGLGLAIARALARTQRGDLIARNHDDGGAEFVLSLPAASGPGELIVDSSSASIQS